MFGLSLGKFLLLCAAVAAVWWGLRLLERQARQRRMRAREAEQRQLRKTVVDLVHNPATGRYEPRRPQRRR